MDTGHINYVAGEETSPPNSQDRDRFGLTFKNRVMMRAIRDLGQNGTKRLTRPIIAAAALGEDNLSTSSQLVTVTTRVKLLIRMGMIEECDFTCACCDQRVLSYRLTALGQQALDERSEEEGNAG